MSTAAADPTAASATELARAIADGATSCVAVMAAFLDRIDAVNPSVNAIVSRVERPALLAQAAAHDRILAERGPMGPLHGLPMAVKDLEAAAGLPHTMGSQLFRDQMPEADSMMVSRLRAAGAIIIGKTNVPEFGFGSQTYNTVFGTTLNAYDLTKTAGGSSGGAAVALATRMVPLADGSDQGGSLRNPAAFNNVFGFRPSFGRVPAEAPDVFAATLSVLGPMARGVADLALLLSVQAGPDRRAPLSAQQTAASVTAPLDVPVAGRRIGWLGDLGGYLAIEPGILPLCESALGAFESLGAHVEPIAIGFPMAELWEAWSILRGWGAATNLGEVYADPAKREALKPEILWEIRRGLGVSGAEIARAQAVRTRWYLHMLGLFERFDHLVLPSAQVFPFPADLHWPRMVAGREMDSYHRWMEVAIPATMALLPSLNVPVGFNEAGLPMGMQIIGRFQDELSCLQIGQAYDLVTRWPDRRRPAL